MFYRSLGMRQCQGSIYAALQKFLYYALAVVVTSYAFDLFIIKKVSYSNLNFRRFWWLALCRIALGSVLLPVCVVVSRPCRQVSSSVVFHFVLYSRSRMRGLRRRFFPFFDRILRTFKTTYPAPYLRRNCKY